MKDRQTKLYDASAFLNIVLKQGSKSLAALSGQAVLDLTAYELGNSIWRISHIQKKITKTETCSLLGTCFEVISGMKVLDIKGIEECVKEISTSAGQSFYDSAYLAVAKKHGLELITDDKRLLNAAQSCKIRASVSDKS